MSQNDFNIANQGFPSFRSDLNGALQALASNSAGTTAPSTTYAYQWWYDETNELLKMRNSDNDAWITIGSFDQTGDTFTPAGVTTDKIEEGNSSVEVVDTGTGYVAITVDGVETARFDANGRLGIATTSPDSAIHINAADSATSGFRMKNTAGESVEFYYASSAADADFLINRTGSGAADIGLKHTGDVYFTSGNVGIGTSSPAEILHIDGGASAGYLKATNNASTQGIEIGVSIAGDGIVNLQDAAALRFFTSDAEAMRIASGGALQIGTTSNVGTANPLVSISQTSGANIAMERETTSSVVQVQFRNPNGVAGNISTSGSSTIYATSSDYRLKENVVALDGAADRLAQIPVHRFNFISDPDTIVDGFLAHEVQAIVPEAVSGEKDAMLDEEYVAEPALGDIYTPAQPATYDQDGVEVIPATDEVIHSTGVEQPAELLDGQQWRETTPAVMATRSVPDYQGIDQSKLVPLLTAALQEALQKIDALEARVTALEG